MTIAVTELLISGGPWTTQRLADQFVRVFKRDQREGYADGFYRLLREVGDGEELLVRINPDSDKPGVATLLSSPPSRHYCSAAPVTEERRRSRRNDRAQPGAGSRSSRRAAMQSPDT